VKKFIALLSAVLLSACVNAPVGRTSVIVYDFGLPAVPAKVNEGWSELMLDVKSPAWADSPHIHYRLAYENALKRREYGESRWAGAPAVLLAQRLRQQLGLMDGNVNATVGCRLNLELHEFTQMFDSPQQSRGVLLADISLIDARRERVAGRRFLIDQPAATPDASGGVAALVSAGDELARQMADWLENEKVGKGFADCRRSIR